MEYLEKYEKWLNDPSIDEEAKKELREIKDDEKEIKERFYKDLEFGTAGLRGIVGIGTNRMNKYTVGKASQGLANYIVKKGGQNRGVAIAYDSRHMSKEFSKQAAIILNANGIKTYLFENLRPTPELSFAVRELNCISGIVVTASHNPPKYNGYKVYWDDGAQISEPTDAEITEEVNKVDDFSQIKYISEEEAINKGLHIIIGKEIDDRYIEAVKKNQINSDIKKDIKIVYTPLHGTGDTIASRLFKETGFNNVFVVEEQRKPNGDFPTVSYPNPEEPKALDLAVKLAKEVSADIVIANDPDADRIGLHVRDSKTGEYLVFTGNMIGLTIAEYLISQNKQRGTLKENTAFIKTIVSSNMADRICERYNVKLFETLTGFKNIAAVMRKNPEYTSIMGYEESYGCLIGQHARDKDGLVTAMMLSEIAAYCKNKGETLWDNMLRLYKEYGYYKENQVSLIREGADGAEQIKNIMDKLRNNPIDKIGENKVIKIKDCLTHKIINLETKEEEYWDLPKSNVLYYEMENDTWCAVRPSGTEPKIKFYMGVKGENLEEADELLAKLSKAMLDLANE